jgi:hypothetical protein
VAGFLITIITDRDTVQLSVLVTSCYRIPQEDVGPSKKFPFGSILIYTASAREHPQYKSTLLTRRRT